MGPQSQIEVKCWLCPQSFKTRRQLKNHLAAAPHRRLSVICVWCSEEKSFRRMVDLKVHVWANHRSKIELMPASFLTENNGFWMATYPDSYAKVIRPSNENSIEAMKARIEVLDFLSRVEGNSRSREQWIQEWKCPKDLIMEDDETNTEDATKRPYSPSRPTMFEDMEIQQVNVRLGNSYAIFRLDFDVTVRDYQVILKDEVLKEPRMLDSLIRRMTSLIHHQYMANGTFVITLEKRLQDKVGKVMSKKLAISEEYIDKIKTTEELFPAKRQKVTTALTPLHTPSTSEIVLEEDNHSSTVNDYVEEKQDKKQRKRKHEEKTKKKGEKSKNRDNDKHSEKRQDKHQDKHTNEVSHKVQSKHQELQSKGTDKETKEQRERVIVSVENSETTENEKSEEQVQDNVQAEAKETSVNEKQVNHETVEVDVIEMVELDKEENTQPECTLTVDNSHSNDETVNERECLEDERQKLEEENRRQAIRKQIEAKMLELEKEEEQERKILENREREEQILKHKENKDRARKLLRTGGMPLFPAGRREWKDEETVTLIIKWSPKSWKNKIPEQKYFNWEFASIAIELTVGIPLQLSKEELLTKYNFLALPGTKTPTLEADKTFQVKSRFYLYSVLKHIIRNNPKDAITEQTLDMLEKALTLRDTTLDKLIGAIDDAKIQLRLRDE